MLLFLCIVFIGNFFFIYFDTFSKIFIISYAYFASTGRWFVSMNYCVHTFMYGYFALRAARIQLPQLVQIFITLLQIIQMIFGCIVNVAAYNYKQKGYPCDISNTNIILSLLLYTSYFVLFAHFFYMTYMQKDTKQKPKQRAD